MSIVSKSLEAITYSISLLSVYNIHTFVRIITLNLNQILRITHWYKTLLHEHDSNSMIIISMLYNLISIRLFILY